MQLLKIPDSDINISDGSVVMLARFPGTKWEVHYGWYEYFGRQSMGWYFCSIPAQTVIPVTSKDLQLITIIDPNNSSSNLPAPTVTTVLGNCLNNISDGCNCTDSDIFDDCGSPNCDCNIVDCKPEYNIFPGNSSAFFSKNDQFFLDSSFISVPSINYRDLLKTVFKIPDGKVVKVNNVNGASKYYSWNDPYQRWDDVSYEVDMEEIEANYYNKEQIDELLANINDTIQSVSNNIQLEITAIKERLSALESAVFHIGDISITHDNTVLVSNEGTLKDSGVSIGDDVISEPSEYADPNTLATEKAVAKKFEDSIASWSSF